MSRLLEAYQAAEKLELDYWDFVNHVLYNDVTHTLVDGKPCYSLDDLMKNREGSVAEEEPAEEEVEEPIGKETVEEPIKGEEPIPEAKVKPLAEPESSPELQPEPKAESKPTPQPKPIPESKPTPQPKPIPESKPTPEPKPTPGLKPTPEAEQIPEWLQKAESILEGRLTDCREEYGDRQVETIVTNLSDYVGEYGARSIFQVDSNDQLFKLENGNLANYFGTLSMFLSELGQEYGDKVPGSYNVRISPENFLPSNLVPTRKKFKSQKKKVEPEVDIGEICRKTGYERSLIEGLANEGWDVHYLDAMLIKGLDLLTDDPFRGGNYLPKVLWLSNAKRALNTAGVSYEAKKFKNHMRKLKQLELLGEKKGKKCYSFNQKWYDVAQGALRDYLSSALSHGDD